MRPLTLAALCALGLILPKAGVSIDMQTTTLDNGMDVIVIPDHRAPVVTHSVWYQAGSMDEQAGRTGIAHMLEHMMFRGTDSMSQEEREDMIHTNGIQENAFTSWDMTAYFQDAAADRLPLLMEQEADRMKNLKLVDDLFQPERSAVLEERQLRTETNPIGRFFEQYIHAHYGDAPYGHPVIGWRKDIEAYTVEKAEDWYNTYYAPNNATLIIAGDVTLDAILPAIKEHYAPLPQANTPARTYTPVPRWEEPQELKVADPEVQVPLWVRYYRAPSAQTGFPGADTADAPALEVLAEVLGGGQTSRLYKALVQEQELADSASTSYDAMAAAERAIEIYVEPKPDVPLSRISQAVEDVLMDVQTNGVSTEEVERAIISLRASEVYEQDDIFQQVYKIGSWIMAGGQPEGYHTYQENLQQVTPAAVQRVAEKYLSVTQSTTGMLAQTEAQF